MGTLVVQLLIGMAVYWSQTTATAQVGGGPMFANFKTAEVTELTIKDKDKNEVVFSKKDDKWLLPKAGDFPADATKIEVVLEKLGKIKTNRLVAKTEASYKQLQVADAEFVRLLEFKLKDGSNHKLYLGSSGGSGANHVRADGAPEVYLTGELNQWDINPQVSPWINTLYFTIPQTATVAVTLENSNGKFEFKQTSSISWTMTGLAAGEVFNDQAFTTLLNQISSLQMSKPLGKEKQTSYGLDKPQAVITIKADKEYTLEIGAKDEKGENYIIKGSTSPYYVAIAKFTGDNLVQKARQDFIQQPPTPTPAPNP